MQDISPLSQPTPETNELETTEVDRTLNEDEQDAYASFSENDEDLVETNATGIASLENLIRQRLEVIEKINEEVTELRTRLGDMLNNSREYFEADQAVKEATKKKKHIKNTILSSSEAQQLQAQLEEAKDFQKDNLTTLNDMLLEWYDTMRVKEIDDLNGHPRDLEIKIKVAPAKKI
jgi:uncharacterized coiled-coil protein SlyX